MGMEKITLAKVIEADDKSQYSEFIGEQLKKYPYSQPIQRLAAEAGLTSEFPMHRYSWKQTLGSNPEIKGANDVISLRMTEISGKKQSPKSSSFIGATSATQKLSSTSDTQPLSLFTQWLQNETKDLDGTGSYIVTEASKQLQNQLPETETKPSNNELLTKAKKKKKSKKSKKKKSLLKQKIEASVERNEEIMTETLAKLYMDQGYYKRALTLYEQLSLKYPEKSSFFAPFIADIKSKLQ